MSECVEFEADCWRSAEDWLGAGNPTVPKRDVRDITEIGLDILRRSVDVDGRFELYLYETCRYLRILYGLPNLSALAPRSTMEWFPGSNHRCCFDCLFQEVSL